MVTFVRSAVWPAIVTVLITHGAHFAFGQYLATFEDLLNWHRTTAATVHFVYSNLNIDTPLGPSDVRLIYCSEYNEPEGTCGGECWVYQGPGSQCWRPPPSVVSCLAATGNIEMCWLEDCTDCHTYDTCGTRLEHGFCWTPDTHSIRLFTYTNKIEPTPSVPSPSSSSTRPAPSNSTQPSVSSSSSRTSESLAIVPGSTSGLSSLPSSNNTSLSSSSSGILSSLHRSSSPSTSTSSPQSNEQNSPKVLPVGAIVGIALGSLTIILAITLSWCWCRTRQKPRAIKASKLPPAEPYIVEGWSVSGAVSTVQYLSKTPPHTVYSQATSTASGSKRSFVNLQRPAATRREVVHEDSGMRITPSMIHKVPVVENPPPYSS
ncbi:hypothetical protein BKA70DRAFT_833862 [Coprinopsis sp. MPI-PUGE-AT-0042]|nr:hypothetical protein BKA70DRAFT_833862 [Coprinopsis sp. MPI-PUGE-AT-0042]